MAVRNLEKIFAPQSVAVIGASQKPNSVGHTVITNLIKGGFAGEIYPVHPEYAEVEQRCCFKSSRDLPNPADLAVVCTPRGRSPIWFVSVARRGFGD